MIIADSREPDELIDLLGATRLTMPVGDYRLFAYGDKTVLIERKTASDFLNSISDGRLQTQLRSLVQESAYPILLLEGQFYPSQDGMVSIDNRDTKWRYDSVMNFIMTLQLSGVYVVNTVSMQATVQAIVSLEEYFKKKDHTALNRHPILSIFPDDPNEQRIQFMSQIPGIGRKLATQIIGRFVCPMDFLILSESQMRLVPGVGSQRAKKLQEFLYGKDK